MTRSKTFNLKSNLEKNSEEDEKLNQSELNDEIINYDFDVVS